MWVQQGMNLEAVGLDKIALIKKGSPDGLPSRIDATHHIIRELL